MRLSSAFALQHLQDAQRWRQDPMPHPHAHLLMGNAPLGRSGYNNAVSQILGESNPVQPAIPYPPPQPRFSTPLGAHVPSNIRAKIWNGQFVEMAHLLPSYTAQDDTRNSKPDSKTQQKVEPKPLRLPDFAAAFRIFITIRAERSPQDAPGMLKHLDTIHEMHRLFGPQAWQHYDRAFRWAMQHNAQMTWGTLDVELYMQATALGLRAQQLPQSRSPMPGTRQHGRGFGFRPTNTCWAYQRSGVCHNKDCKFKDTHACMSCGGAHGSMHCSASASSMKSPKHNAQPFLRKGQRAEPKKRQ